jgi:two-component system, NarL family, response regulator NreC
LSCFRIALADDHAILRDILRKTLSERVEIEVIADVSDGIALLNLLGHLKVLPDMVILDYAMPQLTGLEVARHIRDFFPQIKILMFTMHDENEYVSQAFQVGVDGYLLKEDNAEELFNAINAIRSGQTYRSPLLKASA